MRARGINQAAWWVLCLLLISISARTAPGADDEVGFDEVSIVDAGLKSKLAVTRVGSEPSPNNLLTVFAGLKNKTSKALTLEVETIYKDSLGTPLNAGSWVALSLKPHEEKEYRSASVSEQFDPNAMEPRFLIRIRRAVSPPAPSQ